AIPNPGFAALRCVLAAFSGTTGAPMLLIRPLLQINRERTHVRHTVIFFIFIVSNIGGMLTPLGDPPRSLGYLQGVPFTWTFRLWRPWLLMVATLLLLYFVWDSRQYAQERPEAIRRDRARVVPLRVRGGLNALWLVGVVLAVAFLREPAREVVMLVLMAISLRWTPRDIRRANGFTTYPIVEVAVCVFGFFLTRLPS